MMEIVIKISEEDYKTIKNNYENGFTYKPFGIIANGTPLPKGHGDLIDRDALIFNADYYEPLISKRDVDFAPTIIEGNKSE